MNFSLFENIDMPIMILDNNGYIQYTNNYIEKYLISSISTYNGMHHSKLIASDSINKSVEKYIKDILPEGKTYTESVVVSKEESIAVELCCNPLQDISLFSVLIKEDRSRFFSDKQSKIDQYKDRYTSLLDNLEVAVIVYEAIGEGEDFLFKEMNKASAKIEDINEDYVIGKKLTDMFPGVKKMGLLEALRRVWATGVSEKLPLSFYEDNKRKGWRINYIYRLTNGDVVSIYSDETSSVDAKHRYYKLSKWFSLFLDNFPGFAFIRGLDGEVYYANKKFKEEINIHSENGVNIKNHTFSIEDLDLYSSQDKEVIDENKSMSFEDFINGRYLLTTKFPISLGKKNDLLGIISVDITERRENELQLTKLNEFKNILLSLIGHDLKNPFNVQLGFIEMLINEYSSISDDKKLEYLKVVYDSTSSGFQLLNNLLEWANSNINEISCNPKEIRVKQIIERVLQQNALNLSVKNIDVHIQVSENITAFVDPNMLEVVIRNIFVNAIKFSKTNGDIYFFVESNNTNVEISIEDNGVGMSPELLNKLFEMDLGKVRTGTNGEKGTGLGLYLCNEFMQKNNGIIEVSSQIEKGSKFKLILPIS